MIQLCPDYTTCECPLRSRNPDIKRQESVHDCLNTDGKVGLLGDKKGDINIQPFPNTTSQGSHPNMEMRSCMKQKEKGDINSYFTEGMTHHIQGGGMTSAQDDCFSAAQTSAEDMEKNK